VRYLVVANYANHCLYDVNFHSLLVVRKLTPDFIRGIPTKIIDFTHGTYTVDLLN
jgi:hypothetical protein